MVLECGDVLFEIERLEVVTQWVVHYCLEFLEREIGE